MDVKLIACLLSIVTVWSTTAGSPIAPGACERPADVRHGSFVMNAARDAVSYVCDVDYDLLGDQNIKCKAGDWMGEPPICAAGGCSQLPVLSHGTIIYNHMMKTAAFECDEGYTLTGVKSMVCEVQGWSDVMPTCADKNLVPKKISKHVQMLDQSDYTCITKQKVINPPDEQFTRKSVEWAVSSGKPRLFTIYRCNWGYVPVGGSQNLYCKEGHWIGGHPQCKYAGEYRYPQGLSASKPTSHNGWLLRADYSCLSATTTVSPPSAKWAVSQIKVEILQGMPHMYATYSCEKGYRLASAKQQYMYCEAGEWAGDLPRCIKEE